MLVRYGLGIDLDKFHIELESNVSLLENTLLSNTGTDYTAQSEAGCSKVTTSLVNVSLKFKM